jgi:hypothetical protein
MSNKEILVDYLPFAKATIHETCTLIAATRVRSDQISIPTNRNYAFFKQYGDNTELNITFPLGVTEEILNLTVQVIFSRGIHFRIECCLFSRSVLVAMDKI